MSNNRNQRALMGATPRGMAQPQQYSMPMSTDQLSQFTGQVNQAQMVPQQFMLQPAHPQLAQPPPMYYGQPMLPQQPSYPQHF